MVESKQLNEIANGRRSNHIIGKLKKTNEGYFLPLNFAQSLYLWLQAIEQRNRTIDKHREEFHHLIDMNDVSEIEDQLFTHYIHIILLV